MLEAVERRIRGPLRNVEGPAGVSGGCAADPYPWSGFRDTAFKISMSMSTKPSAPGRALMTEPALDLGEVRRATEILQAVALDRSLLAEIPWR